MILLLTLNKQMLAGILDMLCNDLKLPTDGNANDVNSQALCAKDGLEQKENKKNYYLI